MDHAVSPTQKISELPVPCIIHPMGE